MTCRYCGLPTDGGANHGGTGECVAALKAEAERLLKTRDTTVRLPKPAISDASPNVQQASAPVQNPASADTEGDEDARGTNETIAHACATEDR
jgi:hypothetical protein